MIALLTLFVGATSAIAQPRIGHINSADILSNMPAAKSAEKQLETYVKQLESQHEQKIKSFQSKVQRLETDAPNITPKELETRRQGLITEQESIGRFEMEAQQKVAKKREELLAPILQRAETAIQNVAREQGYDYILDTSLGVVLYADPSNDITGQVKSKLGF